MSIPKDSYELIVKYVADLKNQASTRKSFSGSVVATREAQACYDTACLLETFLRAFTVA